MNIQLIDCAFISFLALLFNYLFLIEFIAILNIDHVLKLDLIIIDSEIKTVMHVVDQPKKKPFNSKIPLFTLL